MIKYLINYRMINPMSEDLFTKAISLFERLDETSYMEYINELMDNTYIGDVIQTEIITILENTADKILDNFGIFPSEEMVLSQKVDMINALLLIDDIDEDLKEEMLCDLEAEDNIEALTNLLGEYFLLITGDLHYIINHVDDMFIETVKDYLQQNDISDVSLEEVYQKQRKKHELEDKYDMGDINKGYLNIVSSVYSSDYVIVNNFEKEGLTVEQYAKRTLIAVTFLSGAANDSIEKVIHLLPEEFEEQVRNFVLGEIYA